MKKTSILCTMCRYLILFTLIMNNFGCFGYMHNQTVALRSKKEIISNPPGANVTIYDKSGKQAAMLFTTPKNVTWDESFNYLKFEMTGYPTQTAKLRKNRFNKYFLIDFGAIFGGFMGAGMGAKVNGATDEEFDATVIVVGGILSIGLLFDIATGSFLTYPDNISVDLTQNPQGSPSQQRDQQNRGQDIEKAVSDAITQIIPRITKNSTIAVIPVSTTNSTLKDFITGEAEYLLVGQGFNIVDRASLDRIRSEQSFQTSGEIDDRTISSIGRFTGANYIITGVIFGQGSLQRLQLRVLDVQTADVVSAPSVPFGDSPPLANPISIEDALQKAIQQATVNVSRNAKLAIVEVTSPATEYIYGESEYLLISKGFRVVDRGQLDRIREEQRIGISGEVDNRTAANIGKLAGAEYLVTIQAGGFGSLTRLRWRILDTQTAMVIGSASVQYSDETSKASATNLEVGLETAISQATTKISKEGRIAIVQITAPNKVEQEYIMYQSESVLLDSQFKVVDRVSLDRVRDELRIQHSGEVDDKTTVDIGKFAGAKYIMTGRIDGTGTLRRLRLRFLDTETAEVVGVASVRIP